MGVVDMLLPSFNPASLLGAAVLLLFVFLYSHNRTSSPKHRQEPPGPTPIPILGNLHQLDLKRPDQTFMKFAKTYGSVFTVYMGPRKTVVLTGYKTIKEALVNYAEEFGEREAPTVAKEAHLDYGVAWANGDSWREMRRFALSNLRDFGMGKRACEDKILMECQSLMKEISKFQGEAFDSTLIINSAVCNVICSMVYGTHFEYDDPEFRTILSRTMKGIQLLGSPGVQLHNLFPRMGKLFLSASKQINQIFIANKKYHLKLLKETFTPHACKSIADAFQLRQQEEAEDPHSHFHNANILVTIMNLFTAGTETAAATLRWALLFMAKYPKIQDQVQEELNRVMEGRQVKVEDRKNLPFTDAVIHETQRKANIIPLSLLHRTSQDVTFKGYFIEKGTTVIPVLTSVLHDENEWEKPNIFYPAHFLSKDGKFLKRDAFMPFSAGRRLCLGEGLARMELFLFFSTLLQHFRITPPSGVSEEELDLTPLPGGTLSPQPHKLCLVSLK
uniref:Cytochrome P450 n=1 Tax=Oryzias melastigma TaxID=30732 RepID=R9S3D4_ORYME|nr:cytochrome P450 [Oryzias melastigma]